MPTKQSGVRFSNRLLYDIERAKAHDRHMHRVSHVKSTIDTKPPKFPRHLMLKYKKTQIKIDASAKIQNENRIMLQKMLAIDIKKSRLHPQVIRKTMPSLPPK